MAQPDDDNAPNYNSDSSLTSLSSHSSSSSLFDHPPLHHPSASSASPPRNRHRGYTWVSNRTYSKQLKPAAPPPEGHTRSGTSFAMKPLLPTTLDKRQRSTMQRSRSDKQPRHTVWHSDSDEDDSDDDQADLAPSSSSSFKKRNRPPSPPYKSTKPRASERVSKRTAEHTAKKAAERSAEKSRQARAELDRAREERERRRENRAEGRTDGTRKKMRRDDEGDDDEDLPPTASSSSSKKRKPLLPAPSSSTTSLPLPSPPKRLKKATPSIPAAASASASSANDPMPAYRNPLLSLPSSNRNKRAKRLETEAATATATAVGEEKEEVDEKEGRKKVRLEEGEGEGKAAEPVASQVQPEPAPVPPALNVDANAVLSVEAAAEPDEHLQEEPSEPAPVAPRVRARSPSPAPALERQTLLASSLAPAVTAPEESAPAPPPPPLPAREEVAFQPQDPTAPAPALAHRNCERCAHLKQACDRLSPCGRCTARGMTCKYDLSKPPQKKPPPGMPRAKMTAKERPVGLPSPFSSRSSLTSLRTRSDAAAPAPGTAAPLPKRKTGRPARAPAAPFSGQPVVAIAPAPLFSLSSSATALPRPMLDGRLLPSLPPTSSTTRLKLSTISSASSSSAKPAKQAKEKPLHPALLSRANWVACVPDQTLNRWGRPPVWCEGRQELCESLEYFKSYQGGHYDNQERCLGYLLDGFPSANDRCEEQGRIIISHGGGCSSADSSPSPSSTTAPPQSYTSTGAPRATYRLTRSQLRTNPRMRALQNCLERATPVVLIAGRCWEFFPRLGEMGAQEGEGGEGGTKGGTRYAVLGHYFVTDMWAEGEPVTAPATAGGEADYHVRFKVRFEWVPAQGKPWFADYIGRDAPPPPKPSELFRLALSPAVNESASLVLDPSSPSSTTTAPSTLFDDASNAPSPAMTDATSLLGEPFGEEDEGKMEDEEEELEKEAVETVTCGTCQRTHRMIYCEAVECYNEECEAFFLVDGIMRSPASLTFHPSLLSRSSSLPTSPLVPEALAPKSLQSLAGTSSISDYSFTAWRGFGCDVCGRMSSRADWDKLRCAGCGAETDARGRAFTADDVRAVSGVDAGMTGRSSSKSKKGKERAVEVEPEEERSPEMTAAVALVMAKAASLSPPTAPLPLPSPAPPVRPAAARKPLLLGPSFRLSPLSLPGFEGYSVDLSDGARVHHLWPATSEGMSEADALFEAYQGDEAGKLFVRNRLSTHRLGAGGLLCQQFTFNSGEHYKHAIGAATYPFPSAPSSDSSSASSSSSRAASSAQTYAPQCAKDARDYLNRVVKLLVGDEANGETEFNEILSVAYMTGGKMNYHDDGERGLGPYVSSISLGTDAIMSFRPKIKKSKCKRSKKEKTATPAPDAADEEAEVNGKGKAKACLKVKLMHGDVFIMEGDGVQKGYEHMVEPLGVRFAATARYVGPEHFTTGPIPAKTNEHVARPVEPPSISPEAMQQQPSMPEEEPPLVWATSRPHVYGLSGALQLDVDRTGSKRPPDVRDTRVSAPQPAQPAQVAQAAQVALPAQPAQPAQGSYLTYEPLQRKAPASPALQPHPHPHPHPRPHLASISPAPAPPSSSYPLHSPLPSYQSYAPTFYPPDQAQMPFSMPSPAHSAFQPYSPAAPPSSSDSRSFARTFQPTPFTVGDPDPERPMWRSTWTKPASQRSYHGGRGFHAVARS